MRSFSLVFQGTYTATSAIGKSRPSAGGIHEGGDRGAGGTVDLHPLIPYLHAALRDETKGQRISLVLLRENPLGEPRGVVAGQHRHGGLHDDGALVHGGADEVDGAAGEAHAGGEHTLVDVDTLEGGQQRGMDVDHPVAPAL